ncbi:unnamed protein product [Victoria cruziana]
MKMETLTGTSLKRLWLLILVVPILWLCFVIFNLHSTPIDENIKLLTVADTVEYIYPNVTENVEKITTEPIDQMVAEDRDAMDKFPFMNALRSRENHSDPCGGRYIYLHTLPRKFNADMLKNCKDLNQWVDMCKSSLNYGLGPPLKNKENVFSRKGWFATDQFALDLVFNNRMRRYECLTTDPSMAAAFFIPFYAGIDVARYLWGPYNISTRDAASLELVRWLVRRPEWKIMRGRDHFLVGGRITWDFRRRTDSESDWGNKLLLLPELKNISMLVIEASPWHANDFAVPYPTYFHPARDKEVTDWQKKVRRLNRPWLFSFVGAPRPQQADSIRGQIINQCKKSARCRLLECGTGRKSCYSPSNVMKVFQDSVFCLQPQGDSFTRRSAFDSILAGCIPVFFHPASAYTQYIWHLPRNYSKYSVFISEDDIREGKSMIEQRLLKLSQNQINKMREEVIRLIPKVVYADSRSKLTRIKDAFDISVQAVIDRVTKLRMNMVNGIHENERDESYSWKYPLLESGADRVVGEYEWDHFFYKQKDNRIS